jgi:hypothetical protein
MAQPMIQRPIRRGNSKWLYGCLGIMLGCGILSVVVVLIAIPLLPRLAMQAAGFTAEGTTDELFAGITPQATVVIVNPVQPDQVTVDLGDLGASTFDMNNNSVDATVGQDSSGVQTARVAVDENGLYQEICFRDSSICNGSNGQYQLTGVDFRPSGAILYATVNVSGFSQQIGAVLRVDGTGRQFEVAGIDVNGQLFAPPSNDIAQILYDIEARGNAALSQFSLQANGVQYALTNMIVDDNYLTLVMQ